MKTRDVLLVALPVIVSLLAVASPLYPGSKADVLYWERLGLLPDPYNGVVDAGRYIVAFDKAGKNCILFDGRYTYTWDGKDVRNLGTVGPGFEYKGWTGVYIRRDAAVAYIEHTGKTLLFGGDLGYLYDGLCADDTWEWDGVEWRYLPIPGPNGRAGHKIVYDRARKEVILFGGYTNSKFVGHPDICLGDTWSYDGTNWRKLASTGPSPRQSFGMTYDSSRQVIVLHGGKRGNRILRDTWEWNGSVWMKRSSNGPRRAGHSIIYDPILNTSVLFGGYSLRNPMEGSDTKSATWAWDGSQWTRLSTEAGPPPRHSHGAVYMPRKKGVVIFGGICDTTLYPQENRAIWLLKYMPADK